MLPDPLQPAMVHLPIALAILIPAFAILGIGLISKEILPPRSWSLIVLLQALLVGFGWLAIETGEDQADRVERVVAEQHIEAHEEAAERFLILAGIGLLVNAAGLLPRRNGSMGRIAGTLASIVVLAASVSVGRLGGELVYEHGAANAYIGKAGTAGSASLDRHFEDDDD